MTSASSIILSNILFSRGRSGLVEKGVCVSMYSWVGAVLDLAANIGSLPFPIFSSFCIMSLLAMGDGGDQQSCSNNRYMVDFSFLLTCARDGGERRGLNS